MIKPVTNTPSSSAQQSDSSAAEVSSNGTFGAMLARQVQEKSAAAPKNSTAAVEANQTQANPAETVNQPDVAVPPASITIASLAKKEIKLPATKVSDTKIKSDIATPLLDANSLNIVNPGIVAGTISQSPAQVTSTPGNSADTLAVSGVSTAIAGKIADRASSLTNPKLAPDSSSATNPKLVPDSSSATNSKLADGGATKLAAEGAAEGSKAADLNNAGAADPKTASATTDFAKLVQAATSSTATTIKPVLEEKTTAVQSEQLASAQAMVNPLPANPTTHSIATPLGSPAWAGEFSQKISWLSHQQSQVAELHLNPPDLGPMHVVISVTDNQATAQFSSPHSEVRHAIENALPKLRDSLADNGIMLGNATVSDQTPRDSGARHFTQPSNRTVATNTAEPAAISVPHVHTRRHTGMLDTFA